MDTDEKGQENIVYFDLETQKSFDDVGGRENISKMGMSLAVTYSTEEGTFKTYLENQVDELVRELMNADRVVGFNVKSFDYEVLRGYTKEPLERVNTVDMLEDIYKALGFRISLDSLAQITLGVKKQGDGLMALHWYQTGEFDKIEEYCRGDVEITKKLCEFGKENGYLFYWDRRTGRKKRIPVNW